MAKLTKIITVLPPNYDGQEAMDENGEWLTLVTNFNCNELEKYKQLISSFNSHVVFGISEEAWGFYEDEGYSFKVSGYGLFIEKRNQLPAFWEHVKRMKHVHKYRSGYNPGFIGYTMNPVRKPKTNTQRKYFKLRQKKRLYN